MKTATGSQHSPDPWVLASEVTSTAKRTGLVVKSGAYEQTVFGVLLPGRSTEWFGGSYYQAARHLISLVRAGVCQRPPRFAAFFG